MSLGQYLRLKKDELMDFLFISLTLGLLFTITFLRFTGADSFEISSFVKFFLFIFVLLGLRLVFMKAVAYFYAFEINLYQTFFDRFWFRAYHKISSYVPGIRGIPSTLISVLIYLVSFGFVIFASLWNYTYRKIPHLHIGKVHFFEFNLYEETPELRLSKTIFWGFLFYLFAGFILKFVLSSLFGAYYIWFMFAIFWIAIFTIMPLPGSEGFELFRKNFYLWQTSLLLLAIGLFSLLILQNPTLVIVLNIFAAIIIIFTVLWKKLM